MTKQTRELIAVGASVTANCQPCLEYHVDQARALGATREDLAEAIAAGRMVRRGAATKLDRVAKPLETVAHASELVEADGCGCA